MIQRNERSYNSETRKRTTKEDFKRQKIQLLKFKFKKAMNNLKKLKHQNIEDYNHLKELMINSERLQKIAHQSRQKTKMFASQSLELKIRKNKSSSSLEKNQVLDFNLLTQLTTQKNQEIQNSNPITLIKQKINNKKQRKKRDEQQIQKLCAIKRQQIEQLSAQNQYSECKSSFITSKKDKTVDQDSKQNSIYKNSICFKSTRIRQSNITVYQKKVLNEGIKPYIMAVIFSILLLFFIRL